MTENSSFLSSVETTLLWSLKSLIRIQESGPESSLNDPNIRVLALENITTKLPFSWAMWSSSTYITSSWLEPINILGIIWMKDLKFSHLLTAPMLWNNLKKFLRITLLMMISWLHWWKPSTLKIKVQWNTKISPMVSLIFWKPTSLIKRLIQFCAHMKIMTTSR